MEKGYVQIENSEENEVCSDILKAISQLIQQSSENTEVLSQSKVENRTKGDLLLTIAIGIGASITGAFIYDLVKTAVQRLSSRPDFRNNFKIKIDNCEMDLAFILNSSSENISIEIKNHKNIV